MMEKEKYRRINEPINSTLYSVQNYEYKWGVVDKDDNVIVEFGKYAWIDGFHNGLAKVTSHYDNSAPFVVAVYNLETRIAIDERRVEQGIINETGEEVLPLEYKIWKFYGKDFPTIKAFKGDVEYNFYFSELNPESCIVKNFNGCYGSSYRDDIDSRELEMDTWDAMTDGQYGDMPEDFDGDYSFLGY